MIKVVWICHLSNIKIREHLKFDKWTPLAIIRRITRRNNIADFAIWNTNAICEFEKFKDIELHIIAPHYQISGLQEFNLNGIHYHFYESEEDNLLSILKFRISKKIKTSYSKNTKIICNLINIIKPDLIHLIGAENPYYCESALYLPSNIPLIVSLQTLMGDPDFIKNYPISKELYNYRSNLESSIIQKADYIGSKVENFRKIIQKEIAPNAIFLNMSLAVGENINYSKCEKKYDFIYFAADISKSIDYALEAFALAKQQFPDITLHVVGGYSDTFMHQIQIQMKELNLGNEVTFTGRLATHDDVIKEIRKAKFALLPLKIDLVTNTIRESMANGLPVITTITPATPKLNAKRECVLLSAKEDFKAMAHNMCKLLNDKKFATSIQQNAFLYMMERCNNEAVMNEWRIRYYEILTSLKMINN